jgi:hypothetical protein
MAETTRSTHGLRARFLLLVALAATVLILAAAPPARAAGDPTAADDQYGGVLGEQSGPGQAEGGRTLPFTGLDLILLGGAGMGLTAAGIAVRRSARGPGGSRSSIG